MRAQQASAPAMPEDLMQPRPAVPPFEPPPPPSLINDSTRRILWIVGLYRAVCGALLLGVALFLDLRTMAVGAPNAFITAAGLYFLYGLAAFLWVQREAQVLPLPILLLSLLGGDLCFLSLLISSGGSAAGQLSILLFPQLAASGWLMRTQVAFFHAALTSMVLLGLEGLRYLQGATTATQLFQTGLEELRRGSRTLQ